MKKIITFIMMVTITINVSAQLYEVPLSSSSNVFTVAGTRTQLWADPALNSVMFIHRDNTGNNINYDISQNGGISWSTDVGPLYNSATQKARYPQGLLVNPSGSANPDSAYVSFLAPLFNSVSWSGIVSGQRQVVAGAISNFDIDTINPLNHLIPSGYMVTPQGIIWSVDAEYINDSIYNDLLIVSKGVWNNGTRKFDFTNQILNAPVSHAGGIARYLGCNIAFSPSGQFGYVVMNANNGSIADSVYYPIVYYTGNGGQTWSTPYNIGLNVDPVFGNGSLFYNMGPQFDIAVDAGGSLHILCEILEGDNMWNSNATPGHFGIFDISSFNGTQWKAELIEMPGTYQAEFGIPGSTIDPPVIEYNRPQISMDVTGNKLFFTWIDTDTNIFGSGVENLFPDLHVKGYDIATQLWTADNNITQFSGLSADASCAFDNVSYNCISGTGNNTIPVTFTLLSNHPISTGSTVFHYYLGGATIQNSQFTLAGNPIILPGGVSGVNHQISGIVYYDVNGNGIMDGGEPPLSNQTIDVQPDGYTLFTYPNGAYYFYS